MISFNTKNCALLAICLCTNLYPSQPNDENLSVNDYSPRYTRMRPPPIKSPKRCDCPENEENTKKSHTSIHNHAERDFFKDWELNKNIIHNDKK